MIRFKKQYENSILNLPGKIQIHKHNVSQYEKILKKQFKDMIEEVQESGEAHPDQENLLPESPSTPTESKG